MSVTICDEGLIIGLKNYGDNILINIFSQNNGLVKAYINNGKSLKNASIYQKGNIIAFNQIKKLPHRLGYITAEVKNSIWYQICDDKILLYNFNFICDLLNDILLENNNDSLLYNDFISLFNDINQKNICLFLLRLLGYCGYMPSLDICSVSGDTKDIIYISPKTGNAVSKMVGEKYHKSLFIIPNFLNNPQAVADNNDIYNALKLLGFFIEKFLYLPIDKNIPHSFMIILNLYHNK